MRITQQIPYSIRLCQRILCAYNYFLNVSVTETAASFCVAVTLRLFNCSLRSEKTSRLDCRQSRTKLNNIVPLRLRQENDEFLRRCHAPLCQQVLALRANARFRTLPLFEAVVRDKVEKTARPDFLVESTTMVGGAALSARFVGRCAWCFERAPRLPCRVDNEGRQRCLAAAFLSVLAPRIGDTRNHAALCQQVLVPRAIARCCASCYLRQPFAMKLNDRAPRLSCRVDHKDRRRNLATAFRSVPKPCSSL